MDFKSPLSIQTTNNNDNSGSDDFNIFTGNNRTNNAQLLDGEKGDETIITSLDDIYAILPKKVKNDFNRLINNGNINIACSI